MISRIGFRISVFVAALIFGLAACSTAPEKMFLGDWVKVDESGSPASDVWVRVTKTGYDLFWENPDGKFPASFENESLNIDFDGFPATAALDAATGILIFTVHGNEIRYQKKR